ncbi:MAG: hypothetical protein K9W46_13115 [Candidatus Heimdallarchaeum endolithica]|uniref:Uncharacterized protein n=1 Tax=Candidatus Heimdallarchaeum endolithica TaxID=2876572 RepID=A0A9Y1BQF4_9ARCH|nr:MAG: hypothetical protein K9W46_13115 [Candidatus Heimdallarchaeum endolithica]
MSKVNVQIALNNIERIKSELEELTQLVVGLKEDLNYSVENSKNSLSSILKKNEEKSENINILETTRKDLQRQISEKTSELNEKTSKKDILNSEIQSKRQDLEKLNSVILTEEKNKTELQTETIGKEEKLQTLNRKIEEKQVLIEATREDTEKEILAKNEQIRKLNDEKDKIVSRAKALKYLLKKNIISLPEINVIRSLNVPGVDTEENIRKTSGVSDQIVRKILMDLDERGIITYETLSGKVQKLTEIDI